MTAQARSVRRARSRDVTRAAVLSAARTVAAREGAAHLSLRAVAAEAGFSPAALYGYFAGKNELLIALAADDLSALARTLRESRNGAAGNFGAAAGAALEVLRRSETFAAATAAFPGEAGSGEAERLFNGRMIAALRALAEVSGARSDSRGGQADVVLLAAALSGLAIFARSGRLEALGFSPADMIAALDGRFGPREE